MAAEVVARSAPAFVELNDLALALNGGQILFATDDFFAVAENLLKLEEPEWKEGVFTEFGKWMDGWETRRKRKAGHDWCIIKLGVLAVLQGIMVDTAFFTGNYAPRISLQAAKLSAEEELIIPQRQSKMGSEASPDLIQQINLLGSENWTELVPMNKLTSGYTESRHSFFNISNTKSYTHVRFNIFPDGGVARLHIYGEAQPDWSQIDINETVDLIAMLNGGICVNYSNAHYGHPRNIIRPGEGFGMADGWETARRLDRPPVLEVNEEGILQINGSEWAIFRLGTPGKVTSIDVDTSYFKGNSPDNIKIEGAFVLATHKEMQSDVYWKILLPTKKLQPNRKHTFPVNELQLTEGISHVRVTIAPDGGVSRLRLWGTRLKE